jgi:hypothetical protein
MPHPYSSEPMTVLILRAGAYGHPEERFANRPRRRAAKHRQSSCSTKP